MTPPTNDRNPRADTKNAQQMSSYTPYKTNPTYKPDEFRWVGKLLKVKTYGSEVLSSFDFAKILPMYTRSCMLADQRLRSLNKNSAAMNREFASMCSKRAERLSSMAAAIKTANNYLLS
jgi:hypothetical protein